MGHRGAPRTPKGDQKRPKGGQKRPKGVPREPKGTLKEPKGVSRAQGDPKGALGHPKELKGTTPKGAKWRQREPKQLKVQKKLSINRPSGGYVIVSLVPTMSIY